jgi:hypothetical protein
MPSKLGFQLHNGVNANSAIEQLTTLRPVAVLAVEDPALLDAAYEALRDGPLYLYQRDPLPDVSKYMAGTRDISQAVDRFIEEIRPSVEMLRWAYHATVSANAINDDLVAFEALAIQRVHERFGARLCIGNFSPGVIAAADWARYRPVLEAAARYNAVVGLREPYPLFPYVGYGPNANLPDVNIGRSPHRLTNEIPYPQNYSQPGQIVGRYRHLRDYCRQARIPVRIVITEIGAGPVLTNWLQGFGSGLGYWRTLTNLWKQFGFADSEAHYLQDIAWLDQHVYGQDPEVVGTCLLALNTPDIPQAEIADAPNLIRRLASYMEQARRNEAPTFQSVELDMPLSYTVAVPRLRVRALPSMNTKYIGGFERGETFTASHYALADGWLWLGHPFGWSAYAPLLNGNPDYREKYVEGELIDTPQQGAAVNQFVGTIDEVQAFIRAQSGQLFYIAINTQVPPEGARQFIITAFPVGNGRRVIDALHPAAGDPLMTPNAKRQLRESGQL